MTQAISSNANQGNVWKSIGAVLAGFFVVVAAVIVELIGQLFRGGPLPRAQS